ncbi:histidine triad nucleotide-binding protein [Candidatus Gottesmanbacteria bacterium]|nr:histidine triad nucleotide-binding protein [Candidatus Gottesmanbacteria bacterium]
MINCIFCKIIKGELPSKTVYKDKDFIVFNDINPKAPVHVLIVPLKHFESLREVSDRYERLLGKMMILVKKIAQKLGIGQTGYKVVINNGKDSGQLVFHLHIHLLGGWKEKASWEV